MVLDASVVKKKTSTSSPLLVPSSLRSAAHTASSVKARPGQSLLLPTLQASVTWQSHGRCWVFSWTLEMPPTRLGHDSEAAAPGPSPPL